MAEEGEVEIIQQETEGIRRRHGIGDYENPFFVQQAIEATLVFFIERQPRSAPTFPTCRLRCCSDRAIVGGYRVAVLPPRDYLSTYPGRQHPI